MSCRGAFLSSIVMFLFSTLPRLVRAKQAHQRQGSVLFCTDNAAFLLFLSTNFPCLSLPSINFDPASRATNRSPYSCCAIVDSYNWLLKVTASLPPGESGTFIAASSCFVVFLPMSFRSVAANCYDQIYCMQLAQNAVHGAMAGYTAFSVGMVNDRTVSFQMSTCTVLSTTLLHPGSQFSLTPPLRP